MWKGLKGLGKLYNYIIISKGKEVIKKRNSGKKKDSIFSFQFREWPFIQ